MLCTAPRWRHSTHHLPTACTLFLPPLGPPFVPIANPALAAGPGSPILQRYASRRFSQGYTSSGMESTRAYESLPVDFDEDLAGGPGRFEMDTRHGQNGDRISISQNHDLTSDGRWLGMTGWEGPFGRLPAICLPSLLVNSSDLCHMPGHYASDSA